MIKQTITWTALPRSSNGPKQNGTELRLSVYVAPRLWNDDSNVTSMPLSEFPDWLDWPALIGLASFQVSFDGGPTLTATPEDVDLRSDLWQALFKPTTTVTPFAFEDLSGVGIKSFPAATIHETIKGVYQHASIDPAYGGGTDLPGRGVLANDPDFSDIARPVDPLPPWEPPETDRGPVQVGDDKPPDEDPGDGGSADKKGCLGCLFWPFRWIQRLFHFLGLDIPVLGSGSAKPARALLRRSSSNGRGAVPHAAAAPTVTLAAEAGDPGLASSAVTVSSVATKAAFDDLHSYAQPHSPISVALPTAAEVEDEFDFHQMISSLGDYPNLMRRLGLVVDLVVTLGADLPTDLGTVSVMPTITLSIPSSSFSPQTHYDLGIERFLARPRANSDINDGLLRLNDSGRFQVIQTDVAGGGIKLQNTATNLRGMEQLQAWPKNAPQDAGLPYLQTAGVSIARAEQVDELVRRFDHSYALNSFLATIDTSPIPVYSGVGSPPAPDDELWSDDLVRGYRIDVWDDKSNQWHSLCRRIGVYEFLEGSSGPISLVEEDEGFVQMASTESLDESVERELRVHESLLAWDGWSLAAPRPGLTILPDQTTGEAPNTAQTQFKLETAFRALPGSLPRQRFGWRYKVRARVVDLAGNSVFDPESVTFADTQAEVTPEFQFTRYEPVAPPSLALRTLPAESESVEHLVVRSSIHDLAGDIANQSTERHVVPPKTSQHMAERHGLFDGTPHISKDQAAYELAAREAGSMTERMNFTTGTLEPIPGTQEQEPSPGRVYWLQTNETFEVAFLPDNFARGVLFMGLPGMPSPDAVIDGVNRIAFDGAWPDLQPFRLQLRGLEANGIPAQPAWNAADRLLMVEVPQGETIHVRYSSYLSAADLDDMGIWAWVKEANPANLADLEKQAKDGRNWLHLPFRELALVHAVQQPLAIPVASQINITPDKQVGDTAVTLAGQVDIDAKSTGQIDLRAAWTDPFDDIAKPSYDAATDIVPHEMHVAEVLAEDNANDELSLNDIRHTLGDTKYHQVTYTPIGTTRYREYFPPAVLANPDDLIRPAPAEVGTPPADSARFTLDVPNSARPDAVKPLYAIPIFAWSESENAGIITKRRRGGGLRLYMARPWFSSGAGELVGLVLRPAKYPPLSANWKTLRQYVSEWGMDPIWRATETAPLELADFDNAVADQGGLSLAELPGLDVGVAGFEAQYDTERDLWFSDIALKAAGKYFPFVRLALARYQRISVDGAHLSRVVLSDFIQVLPHRTVNYDLNQVGSGVVDIRVKGPAYFHPEREQYASPLVVARVERRVFDTGDELGWKTVAEHILPAVQQSTEETVWRGQVQLPNPVPSPMRIAVIESEVYEVDTQGDDDITSVPGATSVPVAGHPTDDQSAKREGVGSRIVFADAIELP